ncbi:MAG: ClpP/crotonase-like domain-containing protein [Olpidium bornovanus]|uniref:ClpP/crotonase-like domain-containing protein n=1 Tax=Olpidium bornovanus TaxID=278681 RepID=A0A8H8A178_9FUNG|nr:MAG: ClpP/crotonase-like domain-containing protein [Olpidium bornovanus]
MSGSCNSGCPRRMHWRRYDRCMRHTVVHERCRVQLEGGEALLQLTRQPVDIGIVADIGVFQRLPRATGNESLLRELAYTGRRFGSEEAVRLGLISQIFETKEDMLKGAVQFAKEVTAKSPIALAGIKRIVEYSRDHSVADGLDYVAVWVSPYRLNLTATRVRTTTVCQCAFPLFQNSAMLQSEDVMQAVMAGLQKRKPTFEKL